MLIEMSYGEGLSFADLSIQKRERFMSFPVFKGFPDLDELLSWAARRPLQMPIPSDLHIHTPYSFSAFTDVHEAVSLAREQGVFVLGISDFNTTRGYEEFTEECQKAGIFPVYCIETIALSVDAQESGRRWNDPSNPGRIYFCGKGLRYPVQVSQHARDTLTRIARALEERIRQMIDRMNRHLGSTVPSIRLDYDHIRDTYTLGTVRERHVAKALSSAIVKAFPGARERAAVLDALYGGQSQVDLTDDVALQNELRSNLLKAGKPAFVEERPEAYVSLEEAKSLILDMGGIPCYPVLADGTKSELTEVERDPEFLCDEILERGIHCAEFIPIRTDIDLLRDYVSVFRRRGVILTAGTEHNTPRMEPMVPMCRGGVELDGELKKTFWKGACVVAAHQYLTSIGRAGYVDTLGKRTDEETAQLESIGEAVIAYYLASPSV
jgi:hypothetical protein